MGLYTRVNIYTKKEKEISRFNDTIGRPSYAVDIFSKSKTYTAYTDNTMDFMCVPNLFKRIQLVSVSNLNAGGSAFSVICYHEHDGIEYALATTMRDFEVLEAIQKYGSETTGIIEGEFCFSKQRLECARQDYLDTFKEVDEKTMEKFNKQNR